MPIHRSRRNARHRPLRVALTALVATALIGGSAPAAATAATVKGIDRGFDADMVSGGDALVRVDRAAHRRTAPGDGAPRRP
ncbi:hypothetical protein [Verrucosispora sioxanthis]|uniref:hypothetical protein n=1 Tax=Verrucosispora sioxanthis TaxID=2499994 RepID=UPI001C1273E0|nr:hypothetical protein [Verrucosispora sioxanthis]